MALTRSHRLPRGGAHQRRRDGGTGELIYAHGGTRHSCGARSADGGAIERGAEVVVTAYDRGIAYVRRWDDLAAEDMQGGGV